MNIQHSLKLKFDVWYFQYAARLYFRFDLSHRNIEDLLAQRGIIVTYESIRLWCDKFGSKYARRLRERHQGYSNTHQSLMLYSTSVAGNHVDSAVQKPQKVLQSTHSDRCFCHLSCQLQSNLHAIEIIILTFANRKIDLV